MFPIALPMKTMFVPNVIMGFISLLIRTALSLLIANLATNGQNMAALFRMDLLIKIALPLTVKANAANANIPIT
jgi:hypothetical protein